MKPTQEWPSVPDNQLQDNTENYTETQSISINFANATNEREFIGRHRDHQIQYLLQDTMSYLARHPFHRKTERTKSNAVTAVDMKHARIVLLQSVQQFYYGDILWKIKDKAKGKQTTIIHQLGLYLDDDGLIRCRRRLQYTQLPHNTKYPILISKESHLSTQPQLLEQLTALFCTVAYVKL